jgi:hypothetical protein
MRKMALVLVAGVAVFGSGITASAQEPPAPSYANVEIVSFDPVTRLVVVRTHSGGEETLELSDGYSGLAGLKAGDRVMMTVRAGPGRGRISGMRSAAPVAPAGLRSGTFPRPQALIDEDPSRAELRDAFAGQVAALSRQARDIDGVWASFATTCGVKLRSNDDGGREWFGLWDGRIQADLSSGFCRDLFNQMVSSGEGIKKAMAAAHDVARRTLDAGEMREILRLNSMEWDGWTLPAPDKLEL